MRIYAQVLTVGGRFKKVGFGEGVGLNEYGYGENPYLFVLCLCTFIGRGRKSRIASWYS